MATAAIVLAVAWTAQGSVPALADQVRSQEWWRAKLHVTRAGATTRGSGVTVALLDTGVDPAQPDLSGSVITGPDLTNSGEKQGSQFFGIHGTAMASLIVGHGHGHGAAGVTGVAPDAPLISVRVTPDRSDPLLASSALTSRPPGAIAPGITHAGPNGAQVIDLPPGPGQTPSAPLAPPRSPTHPRPPPPPPDGTAAEQSAVAYALSKGVVLVAPGGDNGAGTDAPNFPAAYRGVISVGAFNSALIKAAYSSHQSYVTLTAAGDGMIAAVPNGYAPVSSTSAAAAVVTGIVPMIRSQFPELTPAQVTRALMRCTVIRPPGGTTDGSGHGTVDAAKALAAAAAIAAPGPIRAGAGAVSRQLPAAPSASPLAGENLRPKLERYALISLAVLVVLLLLIAGRGLLRRRRRRGRAQREQAARAPYAHNGDGTADMMREYFATLPGQPGGHGGSRSAAGAAGAPGGAAGAPGAGPFADTGVRAGAPAAPPPRAPLPRSPLTPITRASPPRTPQGSGPPPCGPGPQPGGEGPWGGRPAPAALGRPGAHAAPPTGSIWGAAAPAPGAKGDTASGQGAGGGSAGAGSDSRPIYVWNPSETTDA